MRSKNQSCSRRVERYINDMTMEEKREQSLKDWKEKSLHGQFLRDIMVFKEEQDWIWLR